MIKERRRGEQQKMRWLNIMKDSMNMSLSKLQEMTRDRKAWHAAVNGWQRVRHDLGTDNNNRIIRLSP